jgi:hypothetical protein
MLVDCPDGKKRVQQRASKRHYVSLFVKMVRGDGSDLGPCRVLDISRTGARLQTRDASTVPDDFVLLLSANGAVHRRCLVAWRSEDSVGVEFIPEGPDSAPKAKGL